MESLFTGSGAGIILFKPGSAGTVMPSRLDGRPRGIDSDTCLHHGSAITPIFLPWLPGRALSLKGMTLGLMFAIVLVLTGLIPSAKTSGQLETAAWLLLMPAIAAFTAMNFTGSTTTASFRV